MLLILNLGIVTFKVFKFFFYDKPQKYNDPKLIEKYSIIKWFPVYIIISSLPSIITRMYMTFDKKSRIEKEDSISVLIFIQIIIEQNCSLCLFLLVCFSPPYNFILSENFKKLIQIICCRQINTNSNSLFNPLNPDLKETKTNDITAEMGPSNPKFNNNITTTYLNENLITANISNIDKVDDTNLFDLHANNYSQINNFFGGNYTQYQLSKFVNNKDISEIDKKDPSVFGASVAFNNIN